MHLDAEWESDAACVGTAMHTAIETCLYEYQDGTPLSRESTVELWHEEFTELMELENFRFVKYTEASARKFGEACTRQWWDEVLPTLPTDTQLETRFVLPFFEDDERVIELSGAIDYFDGHLRDWKTNGSRRYLPWEYKRWAVQPTVYTWAAVELGLWPQFTEGDDAVPFEYVVMDGKEVQRFTVERDWRDWDFLRTKALQVARLIEAELPSWPVNDNHALCSEKWCPAWAECKGANGITY